MSLLPSNSSANNKSKWLAQDKMLLSSAQVLFIKSKIGVCVHVYANVTKQKPTAYTGKIANPMK